MKITDEIAEAFVDMMVLQVAVQRAIKNPSTRRMIDKNDKKANRIFWTLAYNNREEDAIAFVQSYKDMLKRAWLD